MHPATFATAAASTPTAAAAATATTAAAGATTVPAAVAATKATATPARNVHHDPTRLLHVLRVHAVLQRDGRWHGRPVPSANVLCQQRRTPRVCANRDGRHRHLQLSLRPNHPDVLPAVAATAPAIAAPAVAATAVAAAAMHGAQRRPRVLLLSLRDPHRPWGVYAHARAHVDRV